MATVKMQRILVPTDFSAASNAALGVAVGLAKAFGAGLYVLHVPGTTGENFEADFPYAPFEGTARQIVALRAQAEPTPLRPEYAIRIGPPAAEIVRYAGDRDIDVIVMGTHGRTGAAHLLMGSVAEQVVREAPCPVLTVHHPLVPPVGAADRAAAAAQSA